MPAQLEIACAKRQRDVSAPLESTTPPPWPLSPAYWVWP